MEKISFDVNNGEKLEVCQTKHNGNVGVNIGESEKYNISAGDFVTAAENASRTDTGGGFCVPNLDRVTLPGV